MHYQLDLSPFGLKYKHTCMIAWQQQCAAEAQTCCTLTSVPKYPHVEYVVLLPCCAPKLSHTYVTCLQGNWAAFEAKMKEAKCSDAAVAAFKQNYDQLVAGVTGLVSLNRYELDNG